MKRILLLCTLITTASLLSTPGGGYIDSPTPDVDTNSTYFDTQLLRHFDQVYEQLKQKENFQEGYFETPDKIAINYLYLERPHAQYTIIFCSGFWPGRKEGLATFYSLLPSNANILFFDARGHGKSEGSLWANLHKYGQDEYKDIITAIEFAAEKGHNLPIIVYGTCAGAFNAAHAIIHLEKEHMREDLNIQGLIFDSGWGSLLSITKAAPKAELKKWLNNKSEHFLKAIMYRQSKATFSMV